MTLILDAKGPALVAVCHDCQRRHAITAEQFSNSHAIWDWEAKHRGHRVEFLQPDAFDCSMARNAINEYRHNADLKVAYAADADYTITLASLAESSTLLTGRQSTSVSNTSNLYLDYLIAGEITAGTSPTAGEAIQVVAVGAQDDTPTWPDGAGSSDAAFSFSDDAVKNAIARYLANITIIGTTDFDYFFGPVSLAQLFGIVPTHHFVWVSHDTDVNLNSTAGNHVITYQGVYATIA